MCLKVKKSKKVIRELQSALATATTEAGIIRAGAADAKIIARAEQQQLLRKSVRDHEQIKSVQVGAINKFKKKHDELLANTRVAGLVRIAVLYALPVD